MAVTFVKHVPPHICLQPLIRWNHNLNRFNGTIPFFTPQNHAHMDADGHEFTNRRSLITVGTTLELHEASSKWAVQLSNCLSNKSFNCERLPCKFDSRKDKWVIYASSAPQIYHRIKILWQIKSPFSSPLKHAQNIHWNVTEYNSWQ